MHILIANILMVRDVANIANVTSLYVSGLFNRLIIDPCKFCGILCRPVHTKIVMKTTFILLKYLTYNINTKGWSCRWTTYYKIKEDLMEMFHNILD